MKVVSVNVGAAQPLWADGRMVQSAIVKTPVSGPVAVHDLGLQGDEHADPGVHGGPIKAVYAYPQEHADFWRTVRAQAGAAAWGAPLPAGYAGENLSITGLLESQVWAGDELHFADCVLAVTEPRLPCYKFNARMGFNQAVKMMVQSGYCGFYLAVRKPGHIEAGSTFHLVPGPRELGIAELFKAKMGKA